MTSNDYKRRLAAIFVADVAGYSSLMRNNELETVKTLNLYLELMTDLIRQHHGRVVNSPGDNILAEFASVVDSVQAATAIQRELKERNLRLPTNRRMEFRIGINLGDIIAEEDRIYGDGVNIAARLESLAAPGGIIISRTAYDQIEDKLPFGYEYIGEKRLKNISRPVPVYRVINESLELKEKVKQWVSECAGQKESSQEPRVTSMERESAPSTISRKKKLFLLVLCVVSGIFGGHRLYAGRRESAKMMLFTVGGCGVWFIFDLATIIFGDFADGEGKLIRNWL